MADAGIHLKRSDDILHCRICFGEFSDPRILPCLHTFCLACLETKGENKQPGENMPCPVCKKEFIIPDLRFEGIRKNSFIEKLIELQRLTSNDDQQTQCELCSDEGSDPVEASSLAVEYCIDCNQKLCARCSKMHRKAKVSKAHQVVDVKAKLDVNQITKNLAQITCDLHDSESIKMYCYDCKVANCMICHMECHQGHKCASVDKVGNEYRDRLERIIEKISNCSTDCRQKVEILSEKTRAIETRTKEMELGVQSQLHEMKVSLERQAVEIMHDIGVMKSSRIDEIRKKEREIDKELAELTYFERYAKEIRDKGPSAEVCRIFAELTSRTDELEKDHAVSVRSFASLANIESMQFNPLTCNPLTANTNFFLGTITTGGKMFMTSYIAS